jgi:hypothetical protein
MSSDRTGAVGEAATAAEAASGAGMAEAGSGPAIADDARPDDPWFGPGPKTDVDAAGSNDAYADGGEANPSAGESANGPGALQADWFLRTGRAGLLPDSMTVVSDDADAASTPSAGHHEARFAAAGAPPWAGETTDVSASAPPPWETGPWPGPAGLRLPASAPPASAAMAGTTAAAMQVRWPARTVVTAGLLPLVVPGLVLGIWSLRQPGGRAVRRASWLAIGASIAWVVIIILIVGVTSGGSAASCGGYPAAVHQAYEKALSDLSGNAPASVQAADLETAASRANASAAATGQIGVRTALFAMASDMAQARADVVALRPIPAALRQHLADDGAVPSRSCVG